MKKKAETKKNVQVFFSKNEENMNENCGTLIAQVSFRT